MAESLLRAAAAACGMPSFVPAYVFPSKGGAADPRSEEILERAAQFLWSDAMATSLEAFTENHKDMFVGATPVCVCPALPPSPTHSRILTGLFVRGAGRRAAAGVDAGAHRLPAAL